MIGWKLNIGIGRGEWKRFSYMTDFTYNFVNLAIRIIQLVITKNYWH